MEISPEYRNWIAEVKAKVRSSQIKAAIAVNTALIEFYWDLGRNANHDTPLGHNLPRQKYYTTEAGKNVLRLKPEGENE